MFNYRLLFLAIFFVFNINNAFAATIGNQTISTGSITPGDSINFTSPLGGTLEYDEGSDKSLAGISTVNNAIGTLRIRDTNILTINGDIGSQSAKINNIRFSQSGVLNVVGSIFAQNGITTDTDGSGSLNLSGNNSSVHATIGTSTHKIGDVNINAQNIMLFGNVFSDAFNVNANKSATIASSATTNELGDVELFSGSSLTLNQNVSVESLNAASTSTLTIAAGKTLSSNDDLNISGRLNIGILNTASSTRSIEGNLANDIILNGATLHFDYADATNISLSDTFVIIDDVSSLTLTSVTVTDSSVLLLSSISHSLVDQTLSLSNSIDASTTAKLAEGDLSTLNFLLNNSSISDIAAVRTGLFQISDQAALEDALGTLQLDKSNMVQMVSFSIADRINNVIDYRLHSANLRNKSKDTSNRGLWIDAFGGRDSQDERESEKGYNANIAGVVIGFDKTAKSDGGNYIFGGALSAAQASAKSESASKQNTDINSYHLSLYNHNTGLAVSGFYNINTLDVGYNQYDSSRLIEAGLYHKTAKADFSSMQYGARTSIGYNLQTGSNFMLSPSVGAKYSSIAISDYEEKGAGDIGLNVKNDYFDFASSIAELRLIGNLSSSITTQIKANWTHNFVSDGPTAQTAFIGDDQNFTKITGIDLLQNVYGAGTELGVKIGDFGQILLRYDLQKAEQFIAHSGSFNYVQKF